jgi:transposase
MDYLLGTNRKDVALTARHFGISRKTFYQWRRFEQEFLRGLEERSRTPHRGRSREYTAWQYEHVVSLRKQHLRYGKMKLLELYRRQHGNDESISTWKVQCIIQASGLYYEPTKQARINRKRVRIRFWQ